MRDSDCGIGLKIWGCIEMRKSVKFKVNLLSSGWFGDIDERNSKVDDVIAEQEWHDDERVATDIEYRIVLCKQNGEAVIKATFNYSR